MSNVIEKIEEILDIIKTIDDEPIRALVSDSMFIAIRTLKEVANKENKESIDISDQLDMVTRALNFPIEDLIMHVLNTKFAGQNNSSMPEAQFDINSKEADEDTLDFITADVDTDDYEKFLEENNVKENLDFLKKEI